MIEQHIVEDRQSAHAAATALYGAAKRGTKAGRRYLMQLVSAEPERRHQLRKMFHGPVLRDVSEQVWLRDPQTGERYRNTPAVWKAFFASMFIAPEFEVQVVDGRSVTVEIKPSTERLSDDAFAEFALQSMAFCVTDLGVEFTEEGAQP